MKRIVFRDYDQAELDRQYDQRAWAPNAIELINRYGSDSAAVRQRIGEPETYDYGDTQAESLDLFRTHRAPAPIHVFIHGGAWRLLSARDSGFPAETFTRAGAHYVALDFALLPVVALVTLNELLQVGGDLRHLEIAPTPDLGGDVFRDVTGPAFNGVEPDNPDWVVVLAFH